MAKIPDTPLRKRATIYLALASQAESNALSAKCLNDRTAFLRLAQQWQNLAADAMRFIDIGS
jgi:hypothetical protein